jgi:hypothetical protein
MKHKNDMNLLKIVITVSIIFCLLSCDNGVGPCVHTYNEPILNITSLRDTVNYNHPRFVILRELKINGSKEYGAYPLTKSYGIVENDSIFYCNIPFGFGVEEGKYEFIIEAEGFPPKQITIENVHYSVFEGGCPSYNDGGKRVELIIN